MYAFSMIAYELFEGAVPFQHLHPVEAARRAAMNHARPTWGAANKCAPSRVLGFGGARTGQTPVYGDAIICISGCRWMRCPMRWQCAGAAAMG